MGFSRMRMPLSKGLERWNRGYKAPPPLAWRIAEARWSAVHLKSAKANPLAELSESVSENVSQFLRS
jgi:hypothetical protein